MLRVATLTALLALTMACVQSESEDFEAGCSYANEVYTDIFDAGRQDALDGVDVLDASWQQIDCTAGPSEDWVDGCSTCALEAWNAGWQSAAPADSE